MDHRRQIRMWVAALFGFFLVLDEYHCDQSSDVEKHLEMGRLMLARNQLQDALTHYHAAVDGDPSNYLTFFKRATVYLALGKAKFALADLDRVLELKPDFIAARLQVAQVLLKQGDLNTAEKVFYDVLSLVPSSEEAMLGIQKVEPLKQNIETARILQIQGDHHGAYSILTSVIESMPWDATLREMRAESRMALGDARGAIADIRSVTRMSNDNTEGYLRLSKMYYDIGEAEESLREIRECLRLDADHKECFAHYKIVKKVAKAITDMIAGETGGDFEQCSSEAKKVLKFEPRAEMVRFLAYEALCKCERRLSRFSESLNNCNEALKIQSIQSVFCERAETYLDTDMFDDAIRDYQAALEIEDGMQRAREGIERAKKMQKQSERRDYYKILGVSRQAGKKEIVKAYRKAAQQWHPDNFQGDEKKMAEKKFIDIAAAKEVLTDPEKRQKFDNGEDPLDPEGQRQQGFNPFQQFHNSPFQFKFHFN
ncbi:dnaJ homolog subfamily C member 3 [Cloeon dipterum]|uniref:dnaJ homolog subfamily C member 3 n=1 Tax=Cloeon dipterum TaxID=197152 RepID=UPI003220525E